MYRARFSMAVSSWGNIRCPQKTWNPEGRHLESMAIRSFVILPLASPAKRGIEDLVPEDRLQLFQVQGRSDPEHAPPVEASVRHQDMAVGTKSEEVAKGLDGNDCAGNGILLRYRLPKKDFQGFPGVATQIGKKVPIIEKIPAQDLRDAEDEMPVGNLLEHVGTEPFSEFHHLLLKAGMAKMTTLVPPERDFRFAST